MHSEKCKACGERFRSEGQVICKKCSRGSVTLTELDDIEVGLAYQDHKLYGTGYLRVVDGKLERIDPKEVVVYDLKSRRPINITINASTITPEQIRDEIIPELKKHFGENK